MRVPILPSPRRMLVAVTAFVLMLWLLSGAVGVSWTRADGGKTHTFWLSHGGMGYATANHYWQPDQARAHAGFHGCVLEHGYFLQMWFNHWRQIEGWPSIPGRGFGVPLWFFAAPTGLALAVLAVIDLRRGRQRRRIRDGLCSSCGYNLAGLQPKATCPECGSDP